MQELIKTLPTLITGEMGSLHLSFNDENAHNYERVKEFYESLPNSDIGWVSAEERQKAFDNNSCWTLQWYPNTPVSFHILRASSLEALLAELAK